MSGPGCNPSAPTPTCSATPARRWRWSKVAWPTTSSPRNSTPSAPATSTAPWPAATPRTRTVTRSPASCTRCRTRSPAGKTVQYSVIDTGGRARRTVDIEVTGSPMMHDFSLTDKYVVVYDLPVTFDSAQVLPVSMPRWLKAPARLVLSSAGRPGPGARARSPRWSTATAGRPVGLPYAWNHDYPARIGVMPREGEPTVRWFDVEPCYVFHPLNAYSGCLADRPGTVGARRRALREGVRRSTGAAPATPRPPWTAGRSTSTPVRCAPRPATTGRRSSPESTRRCSAASTVTATPSGSTAGSSVTTQDADVDRVVQARLRDRVEYDGAA